VASNFSTLHFYTGRLKKGRSKIKREAPGWSRQRY